MTYHKTLLNNREIGYIVKKNARSRHLRIAVYCDASVVVTAPVFFGDSKIEYFLKEKASWVLEKLDHFLRLGKLKRIGGGVREYKKYREEARELVIKKIAEVNKIYNFSFGRITIKNHRRRWGSCSIKGNLNFNYRIVFLPDRLAEYIVVHELCHLQEFNHSRNFWNLVGQTVPDYKEIARQIKKQIL